MNKDFNNFNISPRKLIGEESVITTAEGRYLVRLLDRHIVDHFSSTNDVKDRSRRIISTLILEIPDETVNIIMPAIQNRTFIKRSEVHKLCLRIYKMNEDKFKDTFINISKQISWEDGLFMIQNFPDLNLLSKDSMKVILKNILRKTKTENPEMYDETAEQLKNLCLEVIDPKEFKNLILFTLKMESSTRKNPRTYR